MNMIIIDFFISHSYKYQPFYERAKKRDEIRFNLIKNPLNEFSREMI